MKCGVCDGRLVNRGVFGFVRMQACKKCGTQYLEDVRSPKLGGATSAAERATESSPKTGTIRRP